MSALVVIALVADGADLICDAVYVANIVAKAIERALPPADLDAEALARLGLPESKLSDLAASTQSHFEGVSARYNGV